MALAADGRAPRVDIAEVSTAGAGELRLSGRSEIFVLLFFETNILGFLWVDFHGSFLAKPCSFLRIFSVFGKAFFWLDGFLTYILAGDQQAKLYGAKRGDIIGRYSAGIVEYTTKINQQYNTVRAKHMVEYPKKYDNYCGEYDGHSRFSNTR